MKRYKRTRKWFQLTCTPIEFAVQTPLKRLSYRLPYRAADNEEPCRHTYPRIAINQLGVHFSNWPVGPHTKLHVYTRNLIIGDYERFRNVMIFISPLLSPSSDTFYSIRILCILENGNRFLQERERKRENIFEVL